MKPAGDTYPNDDGKSLVRGLAALVVVIAHAIQVFIVRVVGSDAMIAKISGQMAKQAVLVFFIVSGYLITQSIIKNVERNSGRFDAIQFATARIARIYPPLVFAITLCLVFYFTLSFADLPGGNSVAASPLGLPGDLYAARLWFEISSSDVQDVIFMNNGMLQVNGPLWSLCIEWRIYVVAAFFTMALYSKRWPSRIIWILMLWVFARKLGNTNESSYFFLLMWAMGGCVALAEASRFNFQFLRNSAVRLLLICCVCIASIFCPALLLPDGTADPALDYAFQFLMCLMWLGILFPSRQIAIAPIRKLMSRIGDFSYTLYILHFPIFLFIFSLLQGSLEHSLFRSLLGAGSAIAVALIFCAWAGSRLEKKSEISPAIARFISWTIATFHTILSELGQTSKRS